MSFSTGPEAFFSGKFTIFLSDIEKAIHPPLPWLSLWSDYFKTKHSHSIKLHPKKTLILLNLKSEHLIFVNRAKRAES